MATQTSPSNLQSVKSAIIAQLESEMVTGRIAGTQAVGSTWLNDISVWPYISVWPSMTQERIESTGRKRNTVFFTIGGAVKSTVDIETAYEGLYELLDDGAGHGLLAILRDPTLYSWGGLVTYSEIAETRYYDNIDAMKQSAQTQFVAYAVITYRTIQIMPWGFPLS